MDISSVVSFTLSVLSYVLPAAFIWALTDVAVRVVIRAATGRVKDGLF